MGQSTILLINELAPGQTQAFTTVNDMVAALEEASNLAVDLDGDDPAFVSGGIYRVPVMDMLRHAILRVDGQTGPLTLEFPSVIILSPTTYVNRILTVTNLGSYDLTLSTDDVGTTVTCAPGVTRTIHIESQNVVLLSEGGSAASSIPFSVAGFVYGNPPVLTEVTRYVFAEQVTFSNDFSNSVGSVKDNPTASYTLVVKRNGTDIGEIEIDSSGVFTFSQLSADETFVSGDTLTVETPSGADATISGIAFTLRGSRD